jgi:hypothetical protein
VGDPLSFVLPEELWIERIPMLDLFLASFFYPVTEI